MHGKFPQLLSDEVIGEAATRLYNDAQALLKKIIDEKWLIPRGVIGIWPANATAPDTVTIEASGPDNLPVHLEFLRQQSKKQPVNPIFLLQILLLRQKRVKQIISAPFP